MEKKTIAKKVVGFVAGASASYVVTSALKTLVVPDTPIKKVEMFVGCVVLGAYVSTKIEHWTDKQIDYIVDVIVKPVEEEL